MLMFEENAEKFETDMQIFNFNMHQNVVVYFNLLKTNGWVIEDVKRFIDFKAKQLIIEEAKNAPDGEFCLDCGRAMQLLPVNHNLATQTGDPTDKSVWFCRKCGESTYNKESIEEILSSLKIKMGGN